MPARNVAAATPVLLAVIVQLKGLPNATLLLTSLVLVTISSARERKTVRLSVFDVTPPAEAEAVFVTELAIKSAGVTVYVAVQVRLSLGSRKASRSPTVLTAGQVTVALSSVTVTGPSKGAAPLFVTR